MTFVVMCAEKIRRLLRLFFVIIFACFYAFMKPDCLWMVFRDLWSYETADLLLPAWPSLYGAYHPDPLSKSRGLASDFFRSP
jgi:hypothetical protein